MTDRPLPEGVTRNGPPETIAVADIGGTSVKIGFARRGRPLGFTRSHPTGVLCDGNPASTLAALLRSAAGEAALAPDSAVVAVPGLLDKDFDTVLHAANVPVLSGVRLSSGLSARLGMPVLLERDVALQLLGEAIAGAAAGEREVLAVYIGTGIGAAYLGRHGLFRGGGWALEIGHMPVRSPQAGGRPGRIEVRASGAALADLAARHGMAVDALFARAGDSPALSAALDEVLWHQSVAIASAAALFSPKVILVGGGVALMAGYPFETLKRRIAECLPDAGRVQELDIRRAGLGWQAAIHGAVSLFDPAKRPDCRE